MQPPPTLYHYCSENALLGIVGTRRLWLTPAEETNDRAELSWFLTLIRDATMASPEMGYSREEFLANLGVIRTGFSMVCFSEFGDRLDLWHRYADRARGFAIGFDPSRFEVEIDYPWRSLSYGGVDESTKSVRYEYTCLPTLMQVRYEPRNTTTYLDWFRSQHADYPSYSDLLPDILHGSFCTKHDGFAAENEWRLVVPKGPFVTLENAERFKTIIEPSGARLTYDLRWGASGSAITSVCLGPASLVSCEDVRWFLAESGLTDVAVIASELPYRLTR